jgi:hypothetical protein
MDDRYGSAAPTIALVATSTALGLRVIPRLSVLSQDKARLEGGLCGSAAEGGEIAVVLCPQVKRAGMCTAFSISEDSVRLQIEL